MVRLSSSLLLRRYLAASLRSRKNDIGSSYVASAVESSAIDFVPTEVSSPRFNNIAWVSDRVGISTITRKGKHTSI